MHSKTKGDIGQSAIINDLLKKGFRVFLEFGDLSRIDIIAEKNNRLYKIQTKSLKTNSEGSIGVRTSKSGPGYEYRYTENDIDVFAIYSLDTEKIGYIKSSEVLSNKNTLFIRIREAKNKQKSKTRNIEDYQDPNKAFDICLK